MKKIIVIGAGERGIGYSNIAAAMKEDFQIVAVAEPIKTRREYMRDAFHIPEDMCQLSWEDLLSRPKFADLVIIATMDRDHFAPAMAAIEKGYDLLLEKPMSATPKECVQIAQAAKEKGVFVLVCHVLRFTSFFCAIKKLIDEGRLGKIIHIQHAEGVGNLHQAHSFVRGNWRNSEQSTCMILQKCSHDMDIMQWLVGADCSRVHSFGRLSYFKKENAPAGAAERCIDGCPHYDSCYYNAEKYYKSGKYKTFVRAMTKKIEPTESDIDDALRNTDYGRCVFLCDNNVVDHQTVNLEFETGATASFTMCAFNEGSRSIRIMGTDGELIANMSDPFLTLYDFATREYQKIMISEVVLDESIDGGHGGGDYGIIRALRDRLYGDLENISICTIEQTCRNHLIAFAAEESRLTGSVIDMKKYENELREFNYPL